MVCAPSSMAIAPPVSENLFSNTDSVGIGMSMRQPGSVIPKSNGTSVPSNSVKSPVRSITDPSVFVIRPVAASQTSPVAVSRYCPLDCFVKPTGLRNV